MRTWQRTIANTKCGCCPTVIPNGAPVQLVTLPGVKRVSYRCENCADGEAPFLPAQIGHLVSQEPVVAAPMTRIGSLRFDYKKAQAGE